MCAENGRAVVCRKLENALESLDQEQKSRRRVLQPHEQVGDFIIVTVVIGERVPVAELRGEGGGELNHGVCYHPCRCCRHLWQKSACD